MQLKKVFKQISGALEGAFAVALAQNALLISKPIIDIIEKHQVTIPNMAILIFAIINFLAIASNWVSCVAFGEYTTNASFFVDIITLGAFFIVTQVITDLFAAKKLEASYLFTITGFMYIVIHLLFIIWNIYMLKDEQGKRKIINTTNVLNVVAIIIDIFIIIFSFVNQIVAFISYVINLVFWIFMILYFLKEIKEEIND